MRANLEVQKFNVKKTLDEWGVDSAKRDDMMRQAVGYFQRRFVEFEEEIETLMNLFEKELAIKDNIIGQVNTVKDAFIEKTRRLIVKLKVPRKHLTFLNEAGKLEEFVDAKLLGKEP